MTRTTARGTCPSCWVYKDGPRYTLDESQVFKPRQHLPALLAIVVGIAFVAGAILFFPWAAGLVLLVGLVLIVLAPVLWIWDVWKP